MRPGANFHAYTLREPVGVVGQIIPWNFPLLMAAWKLGPALATGNCVVLKPAEQTPLSALLLAELMAEAGVPDGVVNVVTGFGETAGAALAAHDGVDKVAFTGSTEVGKLIVQAAAGQPEEGHPGAGRQEPQHRLRRRRPEAAIAGAANAIFFNHGQCCVAGLAAVRAEDRFDEVVNGVAEIAKSIKLGDGMDADTQMGPLVSDEQLQPGHRLPRLRPGRRGRPLVTGGGRLRRPRLLRGADRAHQHPPGHEDRAGGDLRSGGGGRPVQRPRRDRGRWPTTPRTASAPGIWTKDISKAHALAKKIRAGTVWINCYNVFDAALPFGGYKQSGWGREMGHEALEAYTEVKAVTTQL